MSSCSAKKNKGAFVFFTGYLGPKGLLHPPRTSLALCIMPCSSLLAQAGAADYDNLRVQG